MKPKDIISGFKNDYWNGHARTESVLGTYAQKDCVVAYYKGIDEAVFIIRTEKKFMAFCHYGDGYEKERDWSSYNFFGTKRIAVREAMEIIEKKKQPIYDITDSDAYEILRNQFLIEAI